MLSCGLHAAPGSRRNRHYYLLLFLFYFSAKKQERNPQMCFLCPGIFQLQEMGSKARREMTLWTPIKMCWEWVKDQHPKCQSEGMIEIFKYMKSEVMGVSFFGAIFLIPWMGGDDFKELHSPIRLSARSEMFSVCVQHGSHENRRLSCTWNVTCVAEHLNSELEVF